MTYERENGVCGGGGIMQVDEILKNTTPQWWFRTW